MSEQDLQEQQSREPLGRGPKLVLFGGLAVLVAGAAVAVIADKPEPDEGDGAGAQAICQQFVKDKLKAPSTADFTGSDGFTLDDKMWTAKGVVDSENSFGAKLRNSYECDIEYRGDEQWTLVRIAVR